MTIQATIHCFPEGESGWVQVDPIDYEYTGPDPDGKIESYLDGLVSGSITFSRGAELEQTEVHPSMKIMEIKTVLPKFDPIWFVELPDDYESSITYG